MWYLLTTPAPPNHYFLWSVTPNLWPQVCEWQLVGDPPPVQSLSLTSPPWYVWVRPSPCSLPPLIALTQAYCPLSAAWLNSDCWLVVEMEKEALGVFIETRDSLIYQNNNNPPPHQERERQRVASWLLVSHFKGNVCTRTDFGPLKKGGCSCWRCVAITTEQASSYTVHSSSVA